ncbi:MAG TPA: YdeI/OmpD-associated family protein, partial [Candidatus Bilamarchaeaceae archaeon]|nr:YdeI/OmpD-associated family protein [Candidatus Bilamarchaeaceae archaeon]
IDSTVKKVDEEKFAQRFTPRKPKSQLSQMNRERMRGLITEGKMTKAGLDAVSHAFHPSEDPSSFKIPKRILNEIKKNPDAWKHFQELPKHYVRIRIAYIKSQGRHSEDAFKRSLGNFIRITAKGKRFGMVRD